MNTFVILGILAVIGYVSGDIFSKKFGISPCWSLAVAASVSYLTTSFVWLYYVAQGMEISRGSILFGVASALAGLFVGCVIYHEPLKITDWVGVFLGILSIVMLSLE
jgi:drug/metabolite transporter (DMT)-like permease